MIVVTIIASPCIPTSELYVAGVNTFAPERACSSRIIREARAPTANRTSTVTRY